MRGGAGADDCDLMMNHSAKCECDNLAGGSALASYISVSNSRPHADFKARCAHTVICAVRDCHHADLWAARFPDGRWNAREKGTKKKFTNGDARLTHGDRCSGDGARDQGAAAKDVPEMYIDLRSGATR